MTVKDMNQMITAIKDVTGKKEFVSQCKKKSEKADQLCRFFGGECLAPVAVDSLANLAKSALRNPAYPIVAMKIALSELYHPKFKRQWVRRDPVVAPVCLKINREGDQIELFSFPAFNDKRNQVEPKVTDPYHVLTNARKHATQGVYSDLCSPSSWLKVCRSDSTLLTKVIVEDNVDKQDADLARRVFSEEVQAEMLAGEQHF